MPARPPPARSTLEPDPVIDVIKIKVLHDFLPQVPEIVTFVEKHYNYDANTARRYLLEKVTAVFAALCTPLVEQRSERQRRTDAIAEELAFLKDEFNKVTGSMRKDLRECKSKSAEAVKESASYRAVNAEHWTRLKALMRSFTLPTDPVVVNPVEAWNVVTSNVNTLLAAREDYEKTKQRVEELQTKLRNKVEQLKKNTGERGENKRLVERIAQLTDELVAKRDELTGYKVEAARTQADLQKVVDGKSEQIKTLEKRVASLQDTVTRLTDAGGELHTSVGQLTESAADSREQIERLTANGVTKQAEIERLNAQIDRLTAEIDVQTAEVLRVTRERDDAYEAGHEARRDVGDTIEKYKKVIDSLNRELSQIQSRLAVAANTDVELRNCLFQYNEIKGAYERLLLSLDKANEHFSANGVDCNEPVTKFILEVLAKLRDREAELADFTHIRIPRLSITRPVTADFQAQTVMRTPKSALFARMRRNKGAAAGGGRLTPTEPNAADGATAVGSTTTTTTTTTTTAAETGHDDEPMTTDTGGDGGETSSSPQVPPLRVCNKRGSFSVVGVPTRQWVRRSPRHLKTARLANIGPGPSVDTSNRACATSGAVGVSHTTSSDSYTTTATRPGRKRKSTGWRKTELNAKGESAETVYTPKSKAKRARVTSVADGQPEQQQQQRSFDTRKFFRIFNPEVDEEMKNSSDEDDPPADGAIAPPPVAAEPTVFGQSDAAATNTGPYAGSSRFPSMPVLSPDESASEINCTTTTNGGPYAGPSRLPSIPVLTPDEVASELNCTTTTNSDPYAGSSQLLSIPVLSANEVASEIDHTTAKNTTDTSPLFLTANDMSYIMTEISQNDSVTLQDVMNSDSEFCDVDAYDDSDEILSNLERQME